MKKKLLTPIMILAAIAIGATFYSCTPKDKDTTPTVKQDEETESTSDANDSREESDAVFDESNTVMNDNKSKLGRIDASAADTNNVGAASVLITGDSMITITYTNSLSKDLRRIKTGTVVIKRVGSLQFHELGGQFTVDFQNLEIKRTYDQKKIVINGKFNVKNTTGGHAWAAVLFAAQPAVEHQITGTVNVTLNDGGIRAWEVSRSRTYDYLSVTVGQITGGAAFIEKGKNRRDNEFVTTVPVPVKAEINASCGVGKPNAKVVSGKVEHTVTSGTIATKVTVEFGYSALNTKSTDYCAIKGYHATWTRNLTFGPYFVQVYP